MVCHSLEVITLRILRPLLNRPEQIHKDGQPITMENGESSKSAQNRPGHEWEGQWA